MAITEQCELKGKLTDGGRNDNPARKGRRIGRQLAALCGLKLGKRRIVDIEIGHQQSSRFLPNHVGCDIRIERKEATFCCKEELTRIAARGIRVAL